MAGDIRPHYPNGNGAGAPPGVLDVMTERRLTALEMGQSHLLRRLEGLDRAAEERRAADMNRAEALTKLRTQFDRLLTDFTAMEGEQKRFIWGGLLFLAGVVIQVVRARLGF